MRAIGTLILLGTLAAPAVAEILAEGVYVPCGHQPVKVIAAEFDGMPGMDLATAADTTGTVSILRNLGDGTFAAPLIYTVEPGATRFTLCAADIDGDGDNDIIVGHSTTISILVNDGAAGFTLGASLPTNGQHVMREICAGDIDGDGDIDVLWGNPTFGGGLWLAVNEGGTFAAPIQLFHSKADDPILAHLNDDQFLDVAFHRGSTYEIVVLLGLGDGTFQDPVHYSVTTPYPIRDLAAADLDGDMDLDLVCVTSPDVGGSPYIIALFNLGDGTFGSSVWIAGDAHAPAYGIIAPDLNGSGCAEVVPASHGQRIIFPNDCPGIAYDVWETLLPSASVRDVTAADLDGDADLDVVYAVPGNSSVLVHFNTLFEPSAVAGESPGATDGLRIKAAYPNPFNPRAAITFTVPAAGPVHLEAFDLCGRSVAVLLDRALAAGRHEVSWDSRDLPSGMYFVRLTAAGRATSARLALVE